MMAVLKWGGNQVVENGGVEIKRERKVWEW